MQDSDNDNQPPPPQLLITDLPIDETFHILKWITDEADQKNAQNVCRLWYEIIDEWVGLDITTSTERAVHPNNNHPEMMMKGLELISQLGVRSLHIEDEDLLTAPPSPLPSFKRPLLLRYLKIDTYLHPDIFRNLLTGTANLSVLDFTLEILAGLRASDLEQLSLTLPNLRKLIVGTFQYGWDAPAMPNLRRLLSQNHFPRLRYLQIEFPQDPVQDLETLRYLLPFISRHRALQKLSIETFVEGRHRHPPPLEETTCLENLRWILAGIRAQQNCCPSLELLNLGRSSPDVSHYGEAEIWREFLQKTSASLEEVFLAIGPISNDLIQILCSRHGATLKEAQIFLVDYDQDPVPSFDLTPFSTLQCVETLYVYRIVEITGGVKSLPPTISHLYLSGVMSCEDMEHLLLRMPNMVSLSVHGVHGREGYGFRLKTIQQFVKNRKVNRLFCSKSAVVPDLYPAEGIPNGDPEKPEMLHPRNGHTLWWRLNQDGYYVEG